MKQVFLILTIGLLSACSAMGPKFNTIAAQIPVLNDSSARIYFLRESRFMIGARSPSIEIDGKVVGDSSNGGFFYTDVDDGTHFIKTELWDIPGKYSIQVNLQGGQTYYIEVAPRSEVVTAGLALGVAGQLIDAQVHEKSGAFSLLLLDEEKALEKLKTLSYSG